jgi:hypothetical protein
LNQGFPEDEYSDLVWGYALGSLTQNDARLFEEHIEGGCQNCLAELREFEKIAFALSQSVEPVSPPDSLRDKLMDRISAAVATDESNGADPGLLTIRFDEGEWHDTENAGIQVKKLYFDQGNKTVTTLLRLAPGAKLPKHKHRGIEQCYVISGDLFADGTILGPGDFHVASEDSIHPPLQSIGGATLLLVSPTGYDVIAEHV